MLGLLNAKCLHSLARGRGNRGIIYDIGIGNTLGGNYEYWKNSFIKFTVLQELDVFQFSDNSGELKKYKILR